MLTFIELGLVPYILRPASLILSPLLYPLVMLEVVAGAGTMYLVWEETTNTRLDTPKGNFKALEMEVILPRSGRRTGSRIPACRRRSVAEHYVVVKRLISVHNTEYLRTKMILVETSLKNETAPTSV